MARFADKVTLITGAGSGMGRATARRLAGEGAAVFGTDIDADALAQTQSQVEADGGRMTTHVHDVSQREQCFASVAKCISEYGALHVLANVAGVLRFAHAHEMSEADWQLVNGVNLSGPFFMCQDAIPHLLESGGNIVNVTSNAGLMGQAYATA